jgi:hypothetical protein
MCARVHQHGPARAAAFPANSRGHELYAALGVAIKGMEQHSSTQAMRAHGAREKTAQKRAADGAMRALVEVISRAARSMSSEMPGMAEKFRLPSSKKTRAWLATARAIVTDAEPLAEEFVRRGMAPDFVDDLKARILAVQQAVDGRAQQTEGRVSATTAVAEAARQGLAAVRELDAIVRNVFAGNEAQMAAWESASRVERAPQRAQDEEESPTEPPAQS